MGSVRLTAEQRFCLEAASFDRPIYGENPSFRDAQMPDGRPCFALRTVESLARRGYLVTDKAGGYLLTREGKIALHDVIWGA